MPDESDREVRFARSLSRIRPAVVVTCEHGGNQVPLDLATLFAGCSDLETHRGYDRGAARLAQSLAERIGIEAIISLTSRLVVDLNRSLRHPQLFSERTRQLDPIARRTLLEKHYIPYRTLVAERVRDGIQRRGQVIHLSTHSFTPILDGVERTAEIGLLYDPARRAERLLARTVRDSIRADSPGYRVRFNYPYLGKADGLTTWFRRHFAPDFYIGLEIEINQDLVGPDWESQADRLAAAVFKTVTEPPRSALS